MSTRDMFENNIKERVSDLLQTYSSLMGIVVRDVSEELTASIIRPELTVNRGNIFICNICAYLPEYSIITKKKVLQTSSAIKNFKSYIC
jgi:hypothetical protein